MRLLFFCIIFSLLPNILFAQTSNYFFGNLWFEGKFNNGNFEINQIRDEIPIHISGSNKASICNSQGELILYSHGVFIFNNNHKIIDQDSLLFFHLGATGTQMVIIPQGNRQYFLIYAANASIKNLEDNSFDTFSSALFYTKVDMNISGGKVLERNVKIMNTDGVIQGSSFCRNKDGSYWFVAKSLNTFYSVLIKEGNVTAKVSTFFDPYSFVPEQYHVVPNDTFRKLFRQSIKFSNLGNSLLMSQDFIFGGEGVKVDTLPNQIRIYRYRYEIYSQTDILVFDFDKVTGKFFLKNIQNINTFIRAPGELGGSVWSTVLGLSFSPNDEQLYYMHQETKTNNIYASSRNQKILKIEHFSLNNPSIRNVLFNKPISSGGSNKLYLTPSGNVFLTYINESNYLFTEIENTNLSANHYFREYNLNLDETLGSSLPHFIYDYIKIRSNVDYSCSAVVTFKNISDFSGGMD